MDWQHLRRWSVDMEVDGTRWTAAVEALDIDAAVALALDEARRRGLTPKPVSASIATDGSNLGVPAALVALHEPLARALSENDTLRHTLRSVEEPWAVWASAVALRFIADELASSGIEGVGLSAILRTQPRVVTLERHSATPQRPLGPP